MVEFLLLALQIETVIDQTTIRKRRAALKTIPKGLDSAFEATISRIKAQSRAKSELAMDVLKWSFFAERPLELLELQHALATSPGDTELYWDNFPSKISVLIAVLVLSS
ncbi:Similar to hypothetical protein TRIATDRAFT_305868 [Trichoderma atroviride IMI 206040]; acc. no. EHK48124 [Pyronema omphalodes CBS 100304]|uniref:Uncharacterized protein n=1 Tax=Pyronema omphalodes (strain CBS 100304) TaxID=1076935 RepID=U4LUN4_PYROM|nr:Similar to hypothetical protein TRIATDRAFT_305868 [Trichoderma atroviride IMI 206040]; acc. no. EHK48124 [Pyronema omphalodes CBS 100304]